MGQVLDKKLGECLDYCIEQFKSILEAESPGDMLSIAIDALDTLGVEHNNGLARCHHHEE